MAHFPGPPGLPDLPSPLVTLCPQTAASGSRTFLQTRGCMLPRVKDEASKVKGKHDQPSPHLREGGWARDGGPVPARWDCLSGSPCPSREATRAHGQRLSVPRGHPAGSSPVSQLPGFPGYSPVAEDLFLHMVWENLCFWNNDNLFFPPSAFPPIGRFYKPEQLPEGFQEKILHSF